MCKLASGLLTKKCQLFLGRGITCFQQNGQTFYPDTTTNCQPILASTNSTDNDFKRVNIYPNPFSTQTTLQTDLPDGRQAILHNATLTVYNCFGQQVKQFVIRNSDSFVIRRDNLPSGLYFVRLAEENKTLVTEKIIITDK